VVVDLSLNLMALGLPVVSPTQDLWNISIDKTKKMFFEAMLRARRFQT